MGRGIVSKILLGALLVSVTSAILSPVAHAWHPTLVTRAARTALATGDWTRVQDCAARLDKFGYAAAAGRLRGEAWLGRARQLATADDIPAGDTPAGVA